MRRIFTTRLPSLIFLTALLTGIVHAQGQSSGSRESEDSGVTIREVKIEFENISYVSEQYVLNNLQVKAGDTLDQTVIDESIRALYNTRLFEFIDVDIEMVNDEVADVIFLVRPRFRVEVIAFSGNETFGGNRLLSEMSTQPESFLDELTVKEDVDKLKEFYLKKGYSDVDIEYEVVRDQVRGTARVKINIDEGRKVRIKKIKFEGNNAFGARELKKMMDTSQWSIISFLTGGGKFNEEEFIKDLDKLRVAYKNEGYLDINIDEDKVRFEFPNKRKMNIIIPVDEGQRYRVGNIEIVGNTIFTDDELRPFLKMQRGMVFSPETLDEDSETLTDYYGSRGYLDTFVRAERIPNLKTRAIDINYVVRESERFFVESINIRGNTKTKSTVILRELALSPGDVFDEVRMKTSQSRLENTRFFEQGGVNLTPEPTNIPGRRNLRVSVVEGRTGNLSLGAGFSSLQNATLFLELSQGNFDLFNYRSFFQGDGQKFRLRFQIGSNSSQVTLAFEEPWLFEQRLALGFEAFRTETDFLSSQFNELRTGLEVFLRRRLFELVEGRLSYRYEIVDIKDVSDFASPIIQEEAGNRSVSKLGFSLLRDTRNNLLHPTRGTRVNLITEMAGGIVGGDTDYIKTELRSSKYWTVADWPLEQTFFILFRTGTITPFGDSDRVPFFDRFFLGGPDTLRGFDFRDVGPKDEQTREPTGGGTYGMISGEYVIKLADPLRVAFFYDGGFVNEDDFDFSTDGWNDNVGFGIRMMMLGSPMRLDFGIPLRTDSVNDEGNQFNFSFGSRF